MAINLIPTPGTGSGEFHVALTFNLKLTLVNIDIHQTLLDPDTLH